jgi:transcription antitermination protein NusB
MEPVRHRHTGHARRWSRRLSMQAVYQWQMTGQSAPEIDQQFRGEAELSKADRDYFRKLLFGVLSHIDELDEMLGPHMARLVDHVDPVERAILRCACFELAHCPDVPYKVVINEAVELTKQFGADQGHKFVNGVLDKLALRLRSG